MLRHILIILTLVFSFTFAPVALNDASARIELTEIDVQQVKIELNANTLLVSGAAGKTLHIYNLIGMEVMAVKIDSNEKRIDLCNLKKVVYLVKVGNTSKKINLLGR